MTSKHYAKDRQQRENLINMIGTGTVIKAVKVDKGHINGAEIHKITSTGIVIIYNENSGKLITKLIARPAQIRRYFINGRAPQDLIEKAIEHTKKGYNTF